jgi:hypothetical protein
VFVPDTREQVATLLEAGLSLGEIARPNCHSQTPNFAGRRGGEAGRVLVRRATGVAKRPALPRASMGEAHAETQLRPHSH